MAKVKDHRSALKRAIRQLVRAEIANSWKGAGHPEDVEIIEDELKSSRIRVTVLITQLPFPEYDGPKTAANMDEPTP